MTVPTISPVDPAAQKPVVRPRRRWWRNGKLWIGVLGIVLGSAGTLGVNEAVATLFPHTDRTSRLSDAVVALTGEMRKERDDVARLSAQLRAQEPGSPAAAETVRLLEASAAALVRASDRLAVKVDGAAGTPPRTSPTGSAAAPATTPVSVTPSVLSAPVSADSAPEADLWLRSYQSTLVGTARNALGVRGWLEAPDGTIERVTVGLNGREHYLGAGDRVEFPDPDLECFATYLRSVNADASVRGDERHAFALTCTPRPAPGQ